MSIPTSDPTNVSSMKQERWPGEHLSKSESLPIEKTEFGFVQKSSWRQIDRLDEEVVELDGPHSLTVAPDTQVFTFVLLGDQNAGKSTFLHSFSHQNDQNFLEMTSLLPVLSASFVNTRFLSEADNRAAIDEIPFIDTDIARSTLSLTIDDFAFWVVERNLDHSLVTGLPKGTTYVVIQFLEFGGDHLDQIMNPALALPAVTKDVLQRSKTMLTQCRKLVYFINGASLLRGKPTEGSGKRARLDHVHCDSITTEPSASHIFDNTLNRDTITILCKRLAFLAGLFPSGIDIMATVSRCGAVIISPAAAADAFAILCETAGIGYRPDVVPCSPISLTSLLHSMLQHLILEKKYTLQLGPEVYGVNHLDDEGSLNPEAINQTLANMFKREMVHSKTNPGMFVLGHLIQCFKQPLLRVNEEENSFCLYISSEIFQDYLEEMDGLLEAPDATLMTYYNAAAHRMIEVGLAVRHHNNNLTHLGIEVDDGKCSQYFVVATPPDQTNHTPSIFSLSIFVSGVLKSATQSTQQIRFPYTSTLFEVIETYFDRNVPPELWLETTDWLQGGHVQEVRTKLAAVVVGMSETVISSLPFRLLPSTTHHQQQQNNLSMHVDDDDDGATRNSAESEIGVSYCDGNTNDMNVDATTTTTSSSTPTTITTTTTTTPTTTTTSNTTTHAVAARDDTDGETNTTSVTNDGEVVDDDDDDHHHNNHNNHDDHGDHSVLMRWLWLLEDLYIAKKLLVHNAQDPEIHVVIFSNPDSVAGMSRKAATMLSTVMQPTSFETFTKATIKATLRIQSKQTNEPTHTPKLPTQY